MRVVRGPVSDRQHPPVAEAGNRKNLFPLLSVPHRVPGRSAVRAVGDFQFYGLDTLQSDL